MFPPVGLDDGQHRLHARIVLCLELGGQGRDASIVVDVAALGALYRCLGLPNQHRANPLLLVPRLIV